MSIKFSSTPFLNVPSILSRKRQATSKPKELSLEDSFASDLESSFASTVSLNSPTEQSTDYGIPMDISPMPAAKTASGKPSTRPRAFTSAARLFGNDVSNQDESLASQRGRSGSGASQSNSKRTQRSTLPLEWLMTSPQGNSIPIAPSSPMDDAMDVDTSFSVSPQPAVQLFPAVPHSPAPNETGFSNLFYDTMSPRASFGSPSQRQPKKRRSLSPDAERSFTATLSSSPEPLPSPSDRQLGRGQTSKPFGIGLGPAPVNALKRPRRPVLSEFAQPSHVRGAHSAFPVLGAANGIEEPQGLPPFRRAFSAMMPPTMTADLTEDDSFEGPDGSSPAQAYAQRQHFKTIRRCDGTDDFRPITGASAMIANESPAKIAGHGMPGFGDNELMGKILPCHRVPEDGLMRISPQTLNAVLDGQFDDKVHSYHIIDCRFDYEYAGGHIPGAVNINSKSSIEEVLLGPSLTKPKPSVSGDGKSKTVLIFHCEFSAQRAPTFAKHLRSKDRAANGHVYPKIHYPEVYILEGGYCNYFKTCSERCEPSGYVTMDDPKHAASRREDLDQFRKAKFGRHKSYAYGDGQNRLSASAAVPPKRNTAPNGGSSHVFAAGNAARTRRGGAGLMTLAETSFIADGDGDGDDTDLDIGDSPCPPPKPKGRAPLTRAETYGGPSRRPF